MAPTFLVCSIAHESRVMSHESWLLKVHRTYLVVWNSESGRVRREKAPRGAAVRAAREKPERKSEDWGLTEELPTWQLRARALVSQQGISQYHIGIYHVSHFLYRSNHTATATANHSQFHTITRNQIRCRAAPCSAVRNPFDHFEIRPNSNFKVLTRISKWPNGSRAALHGAVRQRIRFPITPRSPWTATVWKLSPRSAQILRPEHAAPPTLLKAAAWGASHDKGRRIKLKQWLLMWN
jgi:hypothetical protein